ncbi:MAG: LuxR C-terminal-related transcriptional regulator [Actinoplanes sp.]
MSYPKPTGRSREVTQLSAFLDAAATRPMSLALLGGPGIGKTTLLRVLADQAGRRGFRVVRLGTGGALLSRLFPSGDPDVGLTRLLYALDRLTAAAPVLFLIDRADRADPESRRRLTLLMRHLSTERVSFVLAARGSEPPAGIGPEITRLQLPPLADRDAATLLRDLPGHPRQQLLRRGAGNPLALLGGPLPDYDARSPEVLPSTTRRLLSYAAIADESESVAAVTRAAGAATDLSDWQPAEQAQLVAIIGGRVSFTHPLLRNHLAAAAEARQVHAALAASTTDPFRRAMHRAAAAPEPSEQVAATLEAAAASAVPLDRALALQAAAELSPAPGDAARRYAQAVSAACHAGEPAWAIELHHRVERRTTDPDLLGSSAAGAGLALTQLARPAEAFDLLLRAARNVRDGQVAAALICMAATATLISGDATHRHRLRALLARLDDDAVPSNGAGPSNNAGLGNGAGLSNNAGPSDRASLGDHGGPGGHASLRDHGGLGDYLLWPVARAFVRAVADPAACGDAPDVIRGAYEVEQLLFGGAVAWLRDDTVRATTELQAGWRAQSRAGVPGSVIAQLPQLVLALLDGGRWREAADLMDDAERRAAVSGAELLTHVLPNLRLILHSWQGAGSPPEAPAPPPAGNGFAASLHHRAAGLTALAIGDHDAAYESFRLLFDEAGDPIHPVLAPPALPHLALAALRTGRVSQARAIVAGCRAGGPFTARRLMLLDHATALLDDSEEHFRRATGDPDRALFWPLEHAEAQFNFGLWLRRQRRVGESRPHLRAALDTFQRLGAQVLAERAAKYVPGLGPDAAGHAFAALPAHKKRIARLAANGLKNVEIAQRLNVSPRTIASHLYAMYPQLGVANRHQLRELLTTTVPEA